MHLRRLWLHGWYEGKPAGVKLEVGLSAAGQRRIKMNDVVRRSGG
jgi:hypothetical protein